MGKTAGRFEKRYVLESLSAESQSLTLSYGGRTISASLGEVEADAFTLLIIGAPGYEGCPPNYRLDIEFRGLVFRSSGAILGKGPSSLRISLLDPWRLVSISSPQSVPDPSRTALSLTIGEKRFDASWRAGPVTLPAVRPGLRDDPVPRIALATGAEAEYGLLPAKSALSLLERILAAQGKRFIVFDPPIGIREGQVRGLSGFPFLSGKDFLSLCSLDRAAADESGDMERAFADSLKPGIYSPVYIDSKCQGILRYRPGRSPFASFLAADLMRCLLLEDLALADPSGLPEGKAALCLSLQADSAAFWTPLESDLARRKAGQALRMHLSVLGRSMVFTARLEASIGMGSGCLILASLESGRPEDFRFLYENLYGLPLDGDAADYLIKKAAP